MPATTPCPACGLHSSAGEIRCPRCNAFKLTGCTGACSLCKSSCKNPPKPAEEPVAR